MKNNNIYRVKKNEMEKRKSEESEIDKVYIMCVVIQGKVSSKK